MIYTIDEIKRRIEPVAKEYGVKQVYLFGSYARGEATEESDVDLLVDAPDVRGIKTCRLERAFAESVGRNVDLVMMYSFVLRQYPSAYQTQKRWNFVQNVTRERVKLYG